MTTLTVEAPVRRSLVAAKDAIRTILAHVQPEHEAIPRLTAAADLARMLDATLYGVAAETIPAAALTDPTGFGGGSFIPEIQQVIEANMDKAASVFREQTKGLKAEWLAVEEVPIEAVARLSRAADLIVAGGSPLGYRDPYRWCDPAQLVLQSGRPVLVTPAAGGTLDLGAVVVAWKDSREARRALADAMPFLRCAAEVLVMEVCEPDEIERAGVHTEAVADSLKRHGVKARSLAIAAPVERVTTELNRAADAIGAGLIVSGAYGHSRLGEWVFGGVTYDLLHDPRRFVLFSH